MFSTIATVSPSSGNFLQSCDAAWVEQDDNDNDNDNDNEKGGDDNNDDYNNDEGAVWCTSPH